MSKKKYIKGTLYKNGRHIVWFYAPGYIDGKSASLGNISELTGIEIKKISVRNVPSISFGHLKYDLYPVYERLYKTPSDYPKMSLFIKKDSGQPSLIKNEFNNHTIWFSPVPFTTHEIFTHVFQKAGAHIFCDKGDSIAAGSGLLSIHTEQGGKREINLPGNKKVSVEMTPAETLLIDYDSGDILARGN
ncbi:MAG: hypothetical protein R3232_12190 [Clostridia bacterium]|nr:hypothetical protein [Clostridia bacterium]